MAVIVQQLRRSLTCKVSSSSLQLWTPLAAVPVRSINYTTQVMPDLEEYGVLSDQKAKTRNWLTYNDKIFPPTLSGEEPRPAYVCHVKDNIKYSPKKMWYIACFVRGMSVEEALKQLEFVNRKGALVVKEAILEAQHMAVEKHNVEFPTNLWVAESFVGKGVIIEGMRRHARRRFGIVQYRYCNYYIRLEEGKPPENYYMKPMRTKETLLNKWLENMHRRKVINSL